MAEIAFTGLMVRTVAVVFLTGFSGSYIFFSFVLNVMPEKVSFINDSFFLITNDL